MGWQRYPKMVHLLRSMPQLVQIKKFPADPSGFKVRMRRIHLINMLISFWLLWDFFRISFKYATLFSRPFSPQDLLRREIA